MFCSGALQDLPMNKKRMPVPDVEGVMKGAGMFFAEAG